MVLVIVAAACFVGSHFLLSHAWRRPLVARVGEARFLIIYSLVALVTLGWLADSYGRSPPTPPLWPVGNVLWAIATVVMLLASVLLLGSLIGNPSLPGATGAPGAARGVFAVTRHPMMWAVALWGVCHALVYPLAANLVVAGAMVVLALVGAALQDRKKMALQPERWGAWRARTSYWPFAAIAAGRARFGGFRPHDIAGGVVLWLAATWVHIPLSGWHAGIWRWIGG